MTKAELILCFNQGLGREFETLLIDQGDEPLYLPKDACCPFHRIYFAHGFFASALHELAHWCLAGEHRRQLVDYGYWYEPDGRSEAKQAEFESVEVKPQAIEWAFHLALERYFDVSLDNTGDVATDSAGFKAKVAEQLAWYQQHGFPPRAARLLDELKGHRQVKQSILQRGSVYLG